MEQSLDVPFKQPVLLNTISADESTGLFAGPVLSYVVFSNLTNPTILVHPNIEGPQITLLASGHPKMGFSLTPLFVHSVYRGEWRAGLIHGCGVQLRRGQQQGQFDVREGKFFADGEGRKRCIGCMDECACFIHRDQHTALHEFLL
eukprot:scaffold93449_cov19-Tisochrysis_lutea.AAC.2